MSKNLQSVVVWFSFWLLPFLFYFSSFWWLPLHKLSAKGFTAAGTPPSLTTCATPSRRQAAISELRLRLLRQSHVICRCCNLSGQTLTATLLAALRRVVIRAGTAHTHAHLLHLLAHTHTPAGERRELAASVFDLALCFSLLGILIKNAST